MPEVASQQRSERFRERFEQVQDLANKRVAPTEIAQRLGVSRTTIYKYLAMDSPPGRKGSRIVAFELLAPFRPYLLRRWNEGIRNGHQLWREVASQGYRHSRRSVERFVGQLRRETGQPFKFRQVAPAPLYEMEEELHISSLTALQAARLLLKREEERRPKERARLARVRQADPSIEQTYQVTAVFCQMLRTRQGTRLDDWMKQAKEAGVPELRSFAKSLLKDYDAVKAGLTLEWSHDYVAYCTSSLGSLVVRFSRRWLVLLGRSKETRAAIIVPHSNNATLMVSSPNDLSGDA